MVIEPGEVQSIPTEIGKPHRIRPNRAVEFVFTLSDGSTIKGITPAGEELEFTNNGEIVDIKINIYEEPTGPRLVD
ncbi:hypothetical protein ACR4TH_002526 [Enterobacter hormaechei]|uniref:hypothetical protein n=1 Tax=Enterobacter hormaechei TaxID=158836 RepID=UPI0018EA4FB5|nr:hypothetical protein [Enterobacter hormaechei]EHN8715597.1 hypothetical protein [Enterobacter hormaechei]MBJ6376083.1 hypothetical protein [Enterobacter hormaechei]MCL8171558.1 hypothetical protein [Enterobacter hormaechei]MCM7301879.1 hypothetical protein [Enterobacter hormaechei]MCM7350533.1 hypothetical protein [Enterobacter hormaechei]